MSTNNEEQKEMLKGQNESLNGVEEIKRSEELQDEELENVEGGGTCFCRNGNTNNTTNNDQLQQNSPSC